MAFITRVKASLRIIAVRTFFMQRYIGEEEGKKRKKKEKGRRKRSRRKNRQKERSIEGSEIFGELIGQVDRSIGKRFNDHESF